MAGSQGLTITQLLYNHRTNWLWGGCHDDHCSWTFSCYRGGRTVAIKPLPPNITVTVLAYDKKSYGYRRVDGDQWDHVAPGLLDQLTSAIVLHRLKG